MKRSSKQLIAIGFIAACLMGLFLLFTGGGLFSLKSLDFYWYWKGGFTPYNRDISVNETFGKQVVIAAIDNTTLKKYLGDKSRLDRRIYATLVDKLTAMDASIIGFDITFQDTGTSEENQALTDAVKRSQRVVCNCYLSKDEYITNVWLEGRAFCLEQAVGEGYANLTLDRDNFVRRFRLYAPRGDLPCRIPFSLALYLAQIKASPADVVYHRTYISVPRPGGGIVNMPLDYDSHSIISFLGGPGTLASFSIADVLEDKIPIEKVRDKIVLIGGTAEILRDSFHTPFSVKGDFPGVEIHGHILEGLLAGELPREISGPVWCCCCLLLAGFGAILSGRLRVEKGFFVLLSLGFLSIPIYMYIFYALGTLVNIFDIWFALGIAWVTSTLMDAIFLRKEKNTIAQLFHRYVSPNLLAELLEHPEAISLGGARREAVVLFADVRGFTAICEQLKPEQVIAFLNKYFTAVTQVIFNNGGILDKYIGDGLMAFFGVPISHGNEAEKAVIAALKMREELARLRSQGNTGADFPIESIGIGINGGDVVVGNVGSEVHQEYTLLGDTVNVAARLESSAAHGEVLISSWIKERLTEGKFKLIPRGSMKVRGRKNEIEAFEVRGFVE